MTRQPIPQLVRHALARHALAEVSDAELLARFVAHRDADAFTELVERHAALVWGACRRVLADIHLAEDAFQATFVTLARKAKSLRRPENLPGWLYGVARRAAWQHLTARPQTSTGEIPDVTSRAESPLDQLSGKELVAAIEGEVDRLPEVYRSAILLCWFRDCSLDDAARQLGTTRGKLWGWLKRGRERLQRRLARRGYGLPAILGAGLLTGVPAAARLVNRTVDASLSPPAVALVGIAGATKLVPAAKPIGLAALVAATVVGLVTLLPTGAPDAPPAKDSKKDRDSHIAGMEPMSDGFPLPAGAVHRFGNRQLRHADGINASALSPDGNYLATVGGSSVVVWDLKTLTAKCRLTGSYFGTYAYGDKSAGLMFFPDSKSLLVTVRPTDRTSINVNETIELAQVWDIETGKVKFGIKGQWSWTSAAWLVEGGKQIALSSGYRERATIRYFDAKDGKEGQTVNTPLMNRGLWLAVDANRIGVPTESNDGMAVLDAKTGTELYSVSGSKIVQAALSKDGKTLIYHGDNGKVQIHDVDAKKELFAFDHPAAQQRGPMLFSADKQTLYFGGQHGQLYRWDLKNNKRLPDVGRHSTWTLTSIALSPDEQILYSMGNDKLVRRWDLKTGKELPLPDGYTTQTAVVPTRDGKNLIVVDHAGNIDYWDLSTGKHVKKLQGGRAGGLDCVAVSADGRWLAGGRTLQDVQLWNLAAGKLERFIPLVENPDTRGGDHVKRVAFSPDSKLVLSGSGKTGVTAWEVPSGKKVWNSPQAGPLLAYDPTGRWIACGTGGVFRDPPITFTILDPKTGETRRQLEVVAEEVQDQHAISYPPYLTDLAFLPDGSRLLTSHYDGTIRVWDLEIGKEVGRLKGNAYGMSGLAVSPDGRWVGLGRADRKISIWELASGKEVLTLIGHDSGVRDVAFTRDGRGIIGNADLSPVLWSLAPKDLPAVDGPADSLWEAMASDDGAKAFRLQWALVNNPKVAVKLLKEKVIPAELAADRPRFDKLVANLDNPQFRAREASERELLQAGSKIPVHWLRTALAAAKSDEQRARLARVLMQREKPDPGAWRLSRAVQVLELAGTDDARSLLKSWAAAEGSALALDAKAALERLAVR
jgi:RNA polymerase sigma factor (sigma-70 family)